MAVEARPRDQLLQRMAGLDAQKTAYLDISARITAMLSRLNPLTKASTFQNTTATSSNSDALTVSAGQGTPLGTYNFTVRALATTHHLVSRGFSNKNAALTPGTLTLESARARTNQNTKLEELNGGAGVQRGSFKLTDAAGQQANININEAVTLNDVIDLINAAETSITATTRGDSIVLTDTSGGAGTLRIQEVNNGQTAADLGFNPGNTYDTDLDGELVSDRLVRMNSSTPLTMLNDGNGIRRSAAGGDFNIQVGDDTVSVNLSEILRPDTRLQRLNHGNGVRLGEIRITSRDGTAATVDLSNAQTVADVQTALNEAFEDNRLTVTLTGSRFTISDSTEIDDNETDYGLTIEDISGHAAEDLGISTSAENGRIDGRDIISVDTVADVLAAINYATANQTDTGDPLLSATLSDNNQAITLTRVGGGELTINQGNTSALSDLGLAAGTYSDSTTGQRIVSGLDTTLLRTLNGGAGFVGGSIEISAAGGSTTVDLSTAETLSDVITLINQAATDNNLALTAAIDSTGTRLVLRNHDGSSTPITVTDISGTFAQDTGLASADGSNGSLKSENLQKQYITTDSRLDDLNNGRGVNHGTIRFTNTLGQSATLTVDPLATEDLGEVIDEIISLDIGLDARINDTGDGLVIVDTNGGDGTLKIEDDTGTAARDLNIAGESTTDNPQIDGAFEYHLEVGPSDTLETFAARIADETNLATATLLNDGTATAPYRLSLSSRVMGSAGELIVGGDTDFGFATLTTPQDAKLLFGGNGQTGVLLTSQDNTFENVVGSLDITAHQISDEPISVTVDEDIDGIVSKLSGLVESFNAAIERIDEATAYDPETEEAGVLLGDGTVRMAETRLFNAFTRFYNVDGANTLRRLADIGFVLQDGNSFTFDETRFREAWDNDRDAVIAFFTDEDNGVAKLLTDDIERITDPDGLIDRRADTLTDKKDLLQDRVDRMNEMLERKQARLLREFQAMETALAQIQSQQSALADLASSTSGMLSGLAGM